MAHHNQLSQALLDVSGLKIHFFTGAGVVQIGNRFAQQSTGPMSQENLKTPLASQSLEWCWCRSGDPDLSRSRMSCDSLSKLADCALTSGAIRIP